MLSCDIIIYFILIDQIVNLISFLSLQSLTKQERIIHFCISQLVLFGTGEKK